MEFYQTHPTTKEFAGIVRLEQNPREPGKFLIPRGAVSTPPPQTQDNEVAVWTGSSWQVLPDFRGRDYWIYDENDSPLQKGMREIGPFPEGASLEELPEKPKTYEERLADVESQRLSAYQRESDPIFFRWQRGEATEQEWKDKITEIKERYPKPIRR